MTLCGPYHAHLYAACKCLCRPSVTAMAAAFYLARDLITTPCEDLGPQHLVEEARAVAAHHGASVNVIQGEELLAQVGGRLGGRGHRRVHVVCVGGMG